MNVISKIDFCLPQHIKVLLNLFLSKSKLCKGVKN